VHTAAQTAAQLHPPPRFVARPDLPVFFQTVNQTVKQLATATREEPPIVIIERRAGALGATRRSELIEEVDPPANLNDQRLAVSRRQTEVNVAASRTLEPVSDPNAENAHFRPA